MHMLARPQVNPFEKAKARPSHFVTERNFAAIYAAAEFAFQAGLILDCHMTVIWDRLDPTGTSSPQGELTAFLKCMRAWYSHWGLSPAWIYSHENGPVVGPHTHFALSVPVFDSPWTPSYRSKFKLWARTYCQHRTGRKVAGAVRLRMPTEPTPWLHWLNTHYLMKGFARDVVVMDAAFAPDRKSVMLGDLIAFPWRDPGPPAFRSRVGVSSGIGPGQRQLGIPTGLNERGRQPAIVDPFRRTSVVLRQRPFRSRYDQGVRDVRSLYPADFLDRVRPGPAKAWKPADNDLTDISASLDVWPDDPIANSNGFF